MIKFGSSSNAETLILRSITVAIAISLLYFGLSRFPNLYLESEVDKTLFALIGLPIIFSIILLIEFGYSVYRYYKPNNAKSPLKAVSNLPLLAKISILVSTVFANILPYYFLLETTANVKSLTTLYQAYGTASLESKPLIMDLIKNHMESNSASGTMFFVFAITALCALLTPIAFDIVFSAKWSDKPSSNSNLISSAAT